MRPSSRWSVVHLCLLDLATCSAGFVEVTGRGASFFRIIAKPSKAMPNRMRIERISLKMQQPPSQFRHALAHWPKVVREVVRVLGRAMKPVLRAFVRVAMLLSLLALVRTAETQTYQGRELVKAELLADTDAMFPGKPFTAGLLLRMAPGWHTYWQFSGDAALPTELKWKVPPGWKAGELQWPIPIKLKDPGDILTYGYNDEVLLMQQITPPAEIDSAEPKLTADANWLVCEKICIPGGATLALTLPRSTSSHSTNTELFGR